MKLFALIAVTLLFAATVRCQSQFGIFIGPQATTSHYAINGKRQSESFKFGLQAGVNWKIPFENHLYFAPSFFYSLKGYKVKYNQQAYPPDVTATDNNTSIHCFDIAPLLQIDLGTQPNHLYIKFGPSLDLQILGNEKYHVLNGSYVSRQMPYGFAAYGHYAIDMIGQVGFESKAGTYFFVQYGYGLTNLSNEDGGPSIRHRSIGISIGKYLAKKKIIMDTKNKE